MRALLTVLLAAAAVWQAQPAVAMQTRRAQPLHSTAKHAVKDTTVYESEQFVLYVNSRDALGEVYATEDPDLLNWTMSDRRAVDKAFLEVKKRAPGLIARACNGERIHVIVGDMDDPAMDTNCARIKVNRVSIRLGERFLRETLAHELVHYVDCGNAVSSRREWNELISQALDEYRAKFPNSAMLDDSRVRMKAERALHRYHLPSDYSAENGTEALAEIASAMVMSDFKPAEKVSEFINKNILSMPDGPSVEYQLSRAALRLLDAGNSKGAIVMATQMLRMNPDSIDARWLLGRAWDQAGERDLALFEWTQALAIAHKNKVPEYSDDVYTLNANIADLKHSK